MPTGSNGPLRILDVGCGIGLALDVFRAVSPVSVETTGLDYSSQALQIVRAKNHQIIEGRIEKAVLKADYFDIIYSSNVIEHIADPMNMMNIIVQALKPGGVFLCETPNFDSLDARLFSSSGHWGGFHFPRHWTFFSAKTFRKMADQAGLNVESVSYHLVPIFWLWTMHSYFYRGKGRKDLADKYFPLLETKKNFFQSFVLKSLFSGFDLIQKTFTGKTSLMSVIMTKNHTT